MPNLGQRVILRQHGDGRAVASPARNGGAERRLHAANAPLHLEIPLFEKPCQGVGGIMFLVIQLWMGMDIQRNVK